MAAAAGWLDALRLRDEDAVAQLTRYPFEWRQTAAGSCEAKQPATTEKELSPILGCLLEDSSLRRGLLEHDQAGIVEIPAAHLQDWARPWKAKAPTGTVLVNAFIKRSDMQLDMDLWVNQGSVQALWTHVIDGSGELDVAKSWLEALKNRDLRALAQVTSYPFEIRDSGREASCGSRDAAKPAALETAVQCLFKNDELIRALESRAPTIEVAGANATIPNWAEGWWKANKHQDLSKVSAGVTNPRSYSFDMVLMVGSDGVRAFWKNGSLESRD